MSRNTFISLGDHFAGFIEAQVRTGRYGSASELVRAGLRLLEAHEAKVKALEAALIAGEQSGPPSPLDFAASFPGNARGRDEGVLSPAVAGFRAILHATERPGG
jgi:antitoxin ParD1/3/4